MSEFAAAALLAIAFIAFERRVREPMLPLGLFRRPDFTGAQVAAFAIFGVVLRAVPLHDAVPAVGSSACPPLEAGLVYVPGTVIMFFISGASAQLADRVRRASRSPVASFWSTAGLGADDDRRRELIVDGDPARAAGHPASVPGC